MDTYKSPRYVPVAECARLIRADIHAAFPGIKFAVRSHSYSGGGHVSVRWTDGPTSAQVERVARVYNGASFDGMIDLKSHHSSLLNGERVHYGNDWVECTRDYSREFLEDIAREVCKVWGQPVPRIEVSDIGGAYIPWDQALQPLSDWGHDTVREKILEAAQNREASK